MSPVGLGYGGTSWDTWAVPVGAAEGAVGQAGPRGTSPAGWGWGGMSRDAGTALTAQSQEQPGQGAGTAAAPGHGDAGKPGATRTGAEAGAHHRQTGLWHGSGEIPGRGGHPAQRRAVTHPVPPRPLSILPLRPGSVPAPPSPAAPPVGKWRHEEGSGVRVVRRMLGATVAAEDPEVSGNLFGFRLSPSPSETPAGRGVAVDSLYWCNTSRQRLPASPAAASPSAPAPRPPGTGGANATPAPKSQDSVQIIPPPPQPSRGTKSPGPGVTGFGPPTG